MTPGLGLGRLVERLFGRSLKLLRLTIYFTCVFSVLSLLAARALHANVEEAALAFGRQLAELPDLTQGADVISVNGARMHHSRVLTADSVNSVLDRFEEHCTKHPGPVAEVLSEIRQRSGASFEKKVQGSWRHAVLREGSDTDGVLMCFVDDRATGGIAGINEVFARFAKSSDLSEFGQMRYVYAERLEGGKTRVVTLWNEGSLNIGRMFPATGDADGSDSRVVPRPPQARRTLAAAAEGMPFALRTYESGKSRADLQAFYDNWMKMEGFRLGAKVERDGASAYFRKDGYQVILTLNETQGRTYATLIEAGQAASSSIATVEISESP